MSVVAAVDCGATSVRVCRVDLADLGAEPHVVHRVAHQPVMDPGGHLRWDWPTITNAVVEGLELARSLGPIAGIGIDTWAVDYGLLDGSGELIGSPYSYRDHRTDGYRAIVNRFGARRMYEINGLQMLPFNTIFQLAVHPQDELDRAEQLLFLPELLVHHLTGESVVERTSAGSSGLVDVRTGEWSPELLEVAGVTTELLGPIHQAGRVVGTWQEIPVVLVGGHDTASAVVGMGAASTAGSAFVASGTWMLAGIERDRADTSEWARERNFTNEAGVFGGTRFLRNVTGFWLLEQSRPAWGDPPVPELLEAAVAYDEPPIVDVNDPALLSPQDMLSTYAGLAGLDVEDAPGLFTASIVDSIAKGVASTIDQLAEVADVDDLVLFGGAARIERLLRRLEVETGKAVRVGSAEAAAVGNALVQGIALGEFADLADARSRL